MRLQETEEAPQEVGTLEAIRCKVAVQGDNSAPTAVKLELSSESDLFFHYTHLVDERAFKLVREEQRLMIEFADCEYLIAVCCDEHSSWCWPGHRHVSCSAVNMLPTVCRCRRTVTVIECCHQGTTDSFGRIYYEQPGAGACAIVAATP